MGKNSLGNHCVIMTINDKFILLMLLEDGKNKSHLNGNKMRIDKKKNLSFKSYPLIGLFYLIRREGGIEGQKKL